MFTLEIILFLNFSEKKRKERNLKSVNIFESDNDITFTLK